MPALSPLTDDRQRELAEEYRARAAKLERRGQAFREEGDTELAAELDACAVAYVAAAEELGG